MTEPAYLVSTDEKALSDALIGEIDAAAAELARVRREIEKAIYGQSRVIELSLVTLLSGGHMLLIGVPGLAKTKLVETISAVMSLKTQRVQCTPDLMPADILGSEVLEQSRDGLRNFRFIEGPVFTQLFMADEINRASPRTQSALLQAMQEGRVSIGGHYHELPKPFHVLATQNPIEHEGTYPLPEAQLDRFLMQIDISYPDRDFERKMMLSTTGLENVHLGEILSDKVLIAAQQTVRKLPVGQSVVEGILTLVRAGRPEESDIKEVREYVSWGPGPRASQALMLACRAQALLDGRYAPSLDDVLALAGPVLRHRMALNFSARAEGVTIDAIIEKLCALIA